MPVKKLLLFFLIFLHFQPLFSQESKPKKDSSGVYKNIQAYSQKNKFTRFIHKIAFKQVISQKEKNQDDLEIAVNYQDFQGKIIRNINIITLDPFGYSEIDSTKKPRNWLEKSGNSIHVKTKRIAIRNVLLIKKNKPLDSLLVKESMRLMRSQNYINRVAIKTELIGKNNDSVDIYLRVLDSWSLLPRGSVSSNQSRFKLNERNFFGSGHTLNTQYQKRFADGKNAYNLEYIVPNVENTFIETKLNYSIDLDENYKKGIIINRPFYSPFAKWAGGIEFNQQFRKDSVADANLLFQRQNFKSNTQDYWIGHSFKMTRDNSENSRVTNLIVSGRFLNLKYLESPAIEYDSINFYSSEQFFLSGIGITTRKFVQDKYIFRNGQTEDVPIGKIYGITGGYQFKNNVWRPYLGAQASYGNYFKWGFFSLNMEAGTFFEKSVTTQTAFSFQVNYFTNLLNLGKWKLRQFVKPQVLLGINRQNSIADQLSINDDYGIHGFNSAIYGHQKAILTFQTQTYSPWKVLGFRLNPYFNYTIAKLGNTQNKLSLGGSSYSKIGFGLIIINDYLVFRSFQISFAYYPSIPGDGKNVIKQNAFETTDFGFLDFELDKPRTVIYK